MQVKSLFIIIFVVFLFSILGCSSGVSAGDDSPEGVLNYDPNLDLFVMSSIVYVNASEIEWVKELEFVKTDELLDKILRTGVKRTFYV